MQFPQISSCGLLIILVCWLSVNDAIPLGSDPELQVNQTTTFQPNTELPETAPITVNPNVTSTPTSGNGRAYKSIDSINQHDIKKNDEGLTQPHQARQKNRRSPLEVLDTDNNDPEVDISNASNSMKSHNKDYEEWEIPPNKIRLNDKCENEERRQNQTYTRSIPLNTSSINPDDDFKIPGEPEAKKTSSVHVGEDIALCWIETTTIKEDTFFDPPKRLVIREFTISFENSASIPDSYLECNEIEGEIAPGDEDTIRSTALHEVIEENSKRSRQVNFTHVSNVGGVIVRQHKKVKCGVGAVVSKDIFEWPDGTDNPKKRVEIKVGPSIRDLKSTTDTRRAGCTTESIPRNVKTQQNRKSSSTSGDETLQSCESGDCSRTVTSCEGDCSTSSSEETTHPPDSNELLSTGVTEATTTMNPAGTKLPMPLRRKPDRHQDEPCSKFDTDCMSLQSTTVEPQRVNETLDTCLGKDCLTGSSSVEFTDELLCDQSSDPSCLCSGDNCTDKQNTTSNTDDSGQNTMEDSELCKNGSASCICNGSSCSIVDSKEIEYLESEDKRTDVSLNRTSETSMERVEPTSLKTHPNTEALSEQNGTTEIPDDTTSTKVVGQIDDTPGTGNASACNGTDLGNCSNVTPDDTNRSNAIPKDTEERSSSIEDTSSREILREQLQSSSSISDEIESSSTCPEGHEGCATIQSSRKFVPPSNSTDKMADPTSGSSESETISSTSEQAVSVTTIRFNDAEIQTQSTGPYQEHSHEGTVDVAFKNRTDQESSTQKSSTDSIANEKLSSEKRSVTDCSTDSKNSSDCVQLNVTPSLADGNTVPSALGPSTLPSKSCESSENCRSMDSSSRSGETKEAAEGRTQGQTKTASSCDDGDEFCQDSSLSSRSTETCEDGSTNCRSESSEPISRSCDSASGSCSSETNESGMNTTGTIQSTREELNIHSTNNDIVSSIAETRRSLMSTTPLSTSAKGRHKLALRIKILLEHIDENKEKEKLVQIEKHLLLKENSSEHGNNSLMWQVQALNNSINLETLKAIFNCSALKSLSVDEIDVDNLSEDVINDEINKLKEDGHKTEKKYLNKRTVGVPKKNSENLDIKDDNQYDLNDDSNANPNNRKKRAISSPPDITTEIENATDSTTIVFVDNVTDSTTLFSVENVTVSTTLYSMENVTDLETLFFVENVTHSTTLFSVENSTDSPTLVSAKKVTDSTTRKTIRESLPGVEEDLTNGMNHVLSRISKKLDSPATTEANTIPSSSKILKILSNPSDSRVHFPSSKLTPRLKRAVEIQQLTNPVIGEEIERWTKERFVSAAGGGQIRRLTEFRILRDNGEDS